MQIHKRKSDITRNRRTLRSKVHILLKHPDSRSDYFNILKESLSPSELEEVLDDIIYFIHSDDVKQQILKHSKTINQLIDEQASPPKPTISLNYTKPEPFNLHISPRKKSRENTFLLPQKPKLDMKTRQLENLENIKAAEEQRREDLLNIIRQKFLSLENVTLNPIVPKVKHVVNVKKPDYIWRDFQEAYLQIEPQYRMMKKEKIIKEIKNRASSLSKKTVVKPEETVKLRDMGDIARYSAKAGKRIVRSDTMKEINQSMQDQAKIRRDYYEREEEIVGRDKMMRYAERVFQLELNKLNRVNRSSLL